MNFRKAILLLTIYSSFSSATHAQNKGLDSLRNAAAVQKEDTNKVWTLRSIADYYVFNDPDSSIIYAKHALAIAEKFNYDAGMFWSIQTLHNALHITGNYTEELDYALKALPIAKRLNDLSAYG
ncbi:MAG: hypothetical protein ABI691_04615, partial [Ginsengibacter sp.]